MKSYSRTAALVVLGVAAFAWSQEKQATPSPAPQQQDSNAPPAALDSSDNPLTPGDNVRLSAGSPFRLTVPGSREARNFLLWSAALSESAQTLTGGTDNGWADQTTTGMRFALSRAGRGQEFSAGYQGGVQFNGELSGRQAGQSAVTYFHGLNVTETVNRGRWNVSLVNNTQYTPQSNFGFAGNGNIGDFGSPAGGGLGSTLPTVNPSLTPDQSIANGSSARVSNTSAAAVEYRLNSKSSLHSKVSFGLLDFMDGGIDSRQMLADGGYQRRVGRRNWITADAGYSRFWFPGFDGVELNAEQVRLGFESQVTKRLSVAASAGPQITRSEFLRFRALNTSIAANLAYGWRRNQFSLTYDRGTSGGSGVLLGGSSDVITASLSKELRRGWGVAFNGGYSRLSAFTLGTSKFSGEFAGLGISRGITREAHMFFGYGMQRQDGCSLAVCDGIQHRLTLGIDWNHRPIRIR